ncbi:hypothetical protein [Thiolapillus brandeum]|uniref:ABC transporter permease n=1 Tax=Thiolapillus brandeum TaxID=1076588 RepID=A0A7U6GK26_9GAMM|nr:hypothetical protein [Thiolapillus brandeum]BAO44999.1 conserved hypothetical protein [Thiolapillus brandeum]
MAWSDRHLLWLLFRQDMRSLLGFSSLWITLIILSLLVGYSFVQALDLFSQASRTALAYPELGAGLNPVEGIFVPTLGAYYLVETLLLPFVVIRLVGQDRQTGNLKLLLQLPLSPMKLNIAKLAAVSVTGLLLAIPALVAIVAWQYLGGSLYAPELATLLLGHVLYTLAIACIAMFAATVSSTLASAAIICLSITLGSWVLDFAISSGDWPGWLSQASMTTLLRQFENGLLSSTNIILFLAIAALFFFLASVFLPAGRFLSSHLTAVFRGVLVFALAAWVAIQFPHYLDTTEDRRHSFNPADERALKALPAPLEITVHMNLDDSRLYDFQRSVLSRLRRLVPQLHIRYLESASKGLFGAPENDQYGLIEYRYQGRHDQSYSTSSREVLPLIHALAGQQVSPEPVPPYTGHPLVVEAHAVQWLFYLVIPLFFLFGAVIFRYPKLFYWRLES